MSGPEKKLKTFVDFTGEFPKSDPNDAKSFSMVVGVIKKGLLKEGVEDIEVHFVEVATLVEVRHFGERFELVLSSNFLEQKARWSIQTNIRSSFCDLMFGRKEADENYRRFLNLIDTVLKDAVEVRDVRWFSEWHNYEKLEEEEFSIVPGLISATFNRSSIETAIDLIGSSIISPIGFGVSLATTFLLAQLNANVARVFIVSVFGLAVFALLIYPFFKTRFRRNKRGGNGTQRKRGNEDGEETEAGPV